MNPLRLSNYFPQPPCYQPPSAAASASLFSTGCLAAAPAVIGEVGPGAARILVAEDDADVCETICRTLRHAGYQVDSANDGEAGWDALLHYRFNLLLTDNRMPRLSGVELIGRLRDAGSMLPAILASGTLPWEEEDAPQELRPIAVLEKPFTGFELLAKVRAGLRVFVPPSSLVPAAREIG
jgi:DNA-binding response OmpR family regulator